MCFTADVRTSWKTLCSLLQECKYVNPVNLKILPSNERSCSSWEVERVGRGRTLAPNMNIQVLTKCSVTLSEVQQVTWSALFSLWLVLDLGAEIQLKLDFGKTGQIVGISDERINRQHWSQYTTQWRKCMSQLYHTQQNGCQSNQSHASNSKTKHPRHPQTYSSSWGLSCLFLPAL